MIKTIFPSKDATIYEASASINTGLDPILEIRKDISGSEGDLNRSRILIQFDTSTVSSSLSAQGIKTSSEYGSLKYFLKLFVSEEKDVAASYTLQSSILLEDWDMGTGKATSYPFKTFKEITF